MRRVVGRKGGTRQGSSLLPISPPSLCLPSYAHTDRLQSINDVRTTGEGVNPGEGEVRRLHEFITVDQSQVVDKEEGVIYGWYLDTAQSRHATNSRCAS